MCGETMRSQANISHGASETDRNASAFIPEAGRKVCETQEGLYGYSEVREDKRVETKVR